MRSSLYLFFLLHLIHCTLAQQLLSSQNGERTYENAMESYQLGAYMASSELFDAYMLQEGSSARREASYYAAVSRLKSGDPSGVVALEKFIQENPGNPLAGGGYFVLGNHCFDRIKFEEAIAYYIRVNKSQLSVLDQEKWLFRKGYSYMKSGEEPKAERDFSLVLDYRGQHFIDASYYLGSIYFDGEEYNKALDILEPIANESGDYATDVILMIATVYFQTQEYSKLFRYGKDKLTSATPEIDKQLNKLLGEAYFNQKKYDQAVKYLQTYVNLSRKKASAETYFKLGYGYFQIESHDEAIAYFKLAGLGSGAMGQASSFYLGQLYLKKNNLNYAYSAFKIVAEGSWNPDAKEESAFTMGKINVSRGQYADAVADLSSFTNDFPSSRWTLEANELLAEAYLKTSNYDQAIEHLETIPNKSAPLKKAYQKVTFQKGQLMFNDSKFQAATAYFVKSVTYTEDVDLAAQAYYLKGECHSMLNQDDQANVAYQRSIGYRSVEWAKRSWYGLAYLYYNQKDFAQAENYFLMYLNAAKVIEPFYVDAQLRLADCFYVQKNYDQAISQYTRISHPNYVTYVNYQLGLVYGLDGNDQKAKASFELAMKDRQSEYADNAMFQLAELYIDNAKFTKALEVLDDLLSSYPQSPLFPYAKSRQALCYSNDGQYAKARNSYEYILNYHISHEVANAALLGLQEVMKKGESVPRFEEFMAAYQKANPGDSSLESIAFEAAKTSYYNQEYSESAIKMNAFMVKYPQSGFKDDATYFLADSYYRDGSWQKASDQFLVLIQNKNGTYGSRSLDKRGKSLVKLKDYQGAIQNYQLLERISSNRKETYLAHEGLMNTYFELDKIDSALYFADQILNAEWKPADAQNSTWLLKGKVFLKQQKFGSALDEFIKVVNGSKSEEGAEAKYLMGQAYFLQGKNKSSLEMLFDLNKNFASYPYWVGKSFLLIVDNYLQLGELLQARATTKSIVENATIEEIVKEAEAKLKKIEEEEDRVILAEPSSKDSIR